MTEEIREKVARRFARDFAVAYVDASYGYTCEFSASPDQHRTEYDEVESLALTVFLSTPLALVSPPVGGDLSARELRSDADAATTGRSDGEDGAATRATGPDTAYRHPRHPWCQPGDVPNRRFMLVFADQDMRRMYWDGPGAEADAWRAWDQFAPAWSCDLYATLPQDARPSPPSVPSGDQEEP
jgi:hypothetical protein